VVRPRRGSPLKRICVIDFETTGDAPPAHAPCEIGYTRLDAVARDPSSGRCWVVGQTWSLLCDPGVTMPAETAAIHHITDADLVGAPPWSRALSLGADLRVGDCLAAHGMKHERQWLTDDMTGGRPWIDTYRCAMRLWPDAPAFGLQVLRYWVFPAGLSRAEALPAHRAGPDSRVTAFLLRDMLELAQPEQLVEWSSVPAILPRFPFGEHKGKPWSEIEDSLLDLLMRSGNNGNQQS
jgi:exodeoxyribonuclease X